LDLNRKRVLVVGLGRSGIAAAQLCAARGARVTVTDRREWSALGAALAGLPVDIARELGGHRRETFTSAELIVLSPGVAEIPELVAARAAGVAITGELELASRFVSGTLIAITGTNGKSTTTTLVGDIMRATGRPTFVGGNLGDPLAEAVGTPAAAPGGACVVETSSFQLETADRFRPQVAVLLNITADHLDRYADMDAYAAAKARIFAAQTANDNAVVNLDDDLAVAVSNDVEPPARLFRSRAAHRRRLAGRDEGDGSWSGFPMDRRGCPATLPGLVGRHNQANALAALLAGRSRATPRRPGRRCSRSGLRRDRMELVAETGGVAYYDDSRGPTSARSWRRGRLSAASRPDRRWTRRGGDYAPLRRC
jgi:UDP-N-acetylmuramoylalanine--D-glutamate ligase